MLEELEQDLVGQEEELHEQEEEILRRGKVFGSVVDAHSYAASDTVPQPIGTMTCTTSTTRSQS